MSPNERHVSTKLAMTWRNIIENVLVVTTLGNNSTVLLFGIKAIVELN